MWTMAQLGAAGGALATEEEPPVELKGTLPHPQYFLGQTGP